LSQDVLVLAKTEKVLDIELEDIGVCSLEVVFHHLPPIVDVSQRNFVESPLEQAVCKVLAKILVFDCHRFGVNARSHQQTVEDREEGAIVGALVLQLGRPQFNREDSLGFFLPLDSLGELAEQLAHGHLRKVAERAEHGRPSRTLAGETCAVTAESLDLSSRPAIFKHILKKIKIKKRKLNLNYEF
jgi:hypothetical protein